MAEVLAERNFDDATEVSAELVRVPSGAIKVIVYGIEGKAEMYLDIWQDVCAWLNAEIAARQGL